MPSNDMNDFVGRLDINGDAIGSELPSPQLFDAARPSGCINGSALITFDQSVDDESAQDLSDSIILAQLSASKNISKFDAYAEWSAQFGQVLAKLGWITQSVSKKEEAIGGRFDICDWMSSTEVPENVNEGHLWLTDQLRSIAKQNRGDEKLEYLEENSRSAGFFSLMEVISIKSSPKLVDAFIVTYRGAYTLPFRSVFDRMSTEFGDRFEKSLEHIVLDSDFFSTIRQAVRDKVQTVDEKRRPIIL